MHTLSIFPTFLNYQMLGIFLVRIALGFTFIHFWHTGRSYQKAEQIKFFETLHLLPARLFFEVVSIIEGVTGAFLIVGLWTQGVALVGGVLMLAASFVKVRKPELSPKHTAGFYFTLALFSFALLFLGAGAFAFDLPL